MSSRTQSVKILDWHRAVGADAVVQNSPRNWFSDAANSSGQHQTAAPSSKGSLTAPEARSSFAAAGSDARETQSPNPQSLGPQDAKTLWANAHAVAQSAHDLESLRSKLDKFDGCQLKARATQLVFSSGNPEADLMIVGDAPGREEDLEGAPFAGQAGQLLDRMLSSIGLDRGHIYLSNVVPWRPPGDRTPTPIEIASCLPFIMRQIELVTPKILITLGSSATQILREDAKLSIARQRGKWSKIKLGETQIETMAMFHPSFLLKQPLQKQEAWRDLLALQARMVAL